MNAPTMTLLMWTARPAVAAQCAGAHGSALHVNTLVNGNTAVRGGGMWVVGREVSVDMVGSTTSEDLAIEDWIGSVPLDEARLQVWPDAGLSTYPVWMAFIAPRSRSSG